jgi:hypothetical protein
MSCPTCDHTMQRLNEHWPAYYYCPRCGTLRTVQIGLLSPDDVAVPKLVTRCQEFQRDFIKRAASLSWDRFVNAWHHLGIQESIWPLQEDKHESP